MNSNTYPINHYATTKPVMVREHARTVKPRALPRRKKGTFLRNVLLLLIACATSVNAYYVGRFSMYEPDDWDQASLGAWGEARNASNYILEAVGIKGADAGPISYRVKVGGKSVPMADFCRDMIEHGQIDKGFIQGCQEYGGI